jgi:hypothetical protein
MRAILINPFDRAVSEIDLAPGLPAIYAALSGPGFPKGEGEDGTFPTDPAEWGGLEREPMEVRLMDVMDVGGGQDMLIDDEGRFASYQACFTLKGSPPGFLIAGRALIVGHDGQGGKCATRLPIGAVSSLVEWLPWDTDYDPGVPVVTAWP